MASHHARSVLAALAAGAVLTSAGCASTPASTTPASAKSGGAGDTKEPEPSAVSGSTSASGSASGSGSGPATRPTTKHSGSGDAEGRPPWCTAEALSVSLSPGRPAAGNRYAALALTNSSGTACRTQGWPGLQLTGTDGEPVPTDVVRDRSRPSRPLTLAPGAAASARLHWTVVPGEGDPADGDCPEPAGLRVIPPDERTSKRAAWELGTVCGAGEIDVTALAGNRGAEN